MRNWRTGWFLALWASAAASAQTVVTLDARGAEIAPLAKLVGAQAGDVYGRFPAMEVVVFAVSERGKPHRVGRVAVLPTGATQPFRIEPGPAADWRAGEDGRAAGMLALRFGHQADDWSATLAVQASETTPWVDVLVTLENRSKRVLEIPVVDGVTGPRDARLARDSATRATVIGAANGATLAAWTPVGPSLAPASNGPGAWFVGVPGDDPLSGALVRAGKRLVRLGRTDTFWPIEPEGEWDAEQRNRKNWHRVAPGTSRTLARRYVAAPAGVSMPATLQTALATPLQPLRIAPAPTQSLAAKPPQPAQTVVAAPPEPTRVAVLPAPRYTPTPAPAAPPAAAVVFPAAAPGNTALAAPPPPLPLELPGAADPQALVAIPADDGPVPLPALPPLPPPAAKK